MRAAFGQTMFFYEKDAYAKRVVEGGKQWLGELRSAADVRGAEAAMERFCRRLERGCKRMEDRMQRRAMRMERGCRRMERALSRLERRMDRAFN